MGTISYIRDSYVNLLAGLGVPGRDKAASGGHYFMPIDRGQIDAMFRSDWIARKIIEIPPKDATREWRAWQAESDAIEKVEALEKKLEITNKIRQAMVLQRLYGGAALILGVDQGAPEDELDIERLKQDSLKFVHVVNRHQLSLGTFNTDLSSPYFGLPDYYSANTVADLGGVNARRNSLQKTISLTGVRIHPSRVIALRGAFVPQDSIGGTTYDTFWGDSVLQIVQDAVLAAGLVTSSIATLVSEAKVDVIKIPELSRNIATQAYRDKLSTRFAFANAQKSAVNTLILDKEEEWDRIETQFSALPDILKLYLLIASGAADIPATRMLGQSPVGLQATGESDVRNYYDRIASDQNGELAPVMTPLDEVLLRSALGSRDPSIYYEWNSLWQMSDAEKAAIAKQKADTAKIDSEMGLIDPEALRIGRQNQLIEDGTYPGLETALEQQQELDESSMLSPEEQDAEAIQRQQETMALMTQAAPSGEQEGGPAPKKAIPFDSHNTDGLYVISRDSYNPDQPRAEAGSPEGGQWISGGGSGSPGGGVAVSPEVAEEFKQAGIAASPSYFNPWSKPEQTAGSMKLRGKTFKLIDHPNTDKLVANLKEINSKSFPKKTDFVPYQDAISSYSASGYHTINKFLRNDKGHVYYPTGAEEKVSTNKKIAVLDAMFEKANIASDVVLFRGIGKTGWTEIGKAKVGDVIVDPGYGSASASRGIAGSFAASGSPTAEIFVPKGAHAISLATSGAPSEREVLFARDSKFEVIAIDRGLSPEGLSTGKPKLRLLYIPPHEGPVLNTPPIIGASEEQLSLFGSAPEKQASLFEPSVIAKIAATTPPAPEPLPVPSGPTPEEVAAAKVEFVYKESKIKSVFVNGVQIGTSHKLPSGSFKIVLPGENGQTYPVATTEEAKAKAIELYFAKKASEPSVATGTESVEFKPTSEPGAYDVHVGTLKVAKVEATENGTGWNLTTNSGQKFKFGTYEDVKKKALALAASAKIIAPKIVAHETFVSQIELAANSPTNVMPSVAPVAPVANAAPVAPSAAKLGIGAKNESGWRPIRVNGKVIGIARWDKGLGAVLQLQGNDPPLKFTTLQAMKKAVEEKGWPPTWHSQYAFKS